MTHMQHPPPKRPRRSQCWSSSPGLRRVAGRAVWFIMTLTLLLDKIFRPKSLCPFHPSIHPSIPRWHPEHTLCPPRKDPSKEEATVELEGFQVIVCCLHRSTTRPWPSPLGTIRISISPGAHSITSPRKIHDHPSWSSPSSHEFFSGLSSTCYIGAKSISPSSPKEVTQALFRRAVFCQGVSTNHHHLTSNLRMQI